MSNNMIVMVVCSFLLLAMVVALTVGFGRYEYKERKEVNSSEKAIKSICQPTTYQETCIESLESSPASNTTDPKELIQASLDITIHRLRDAMKKSRHLKELEKDPRSKEALDDCQFLAKRAEKDLNRTFEQFSEFDLTDLDNWLADLKTWLSGSLTYQETCLDGFEGTPGDHQEKMKQLLNTSMQLTSNALAMVTEISSVLSELGVEGVSSSSKRRLLGHDMTTTATPEWVDLGRHRLLTAKRSEIKPDLVVAKDGSGKYMTINEALEDIPRKKNKTFVLYIKEGVYEEQVVFFRNMTHLTIMGDGPTKTKITGSKNYIDGVSTFHTATVAAMGDFFMARDIGFENSAGPEKHQAVALRVGADRSIFYNCQMDGYQDTLYTHTYRQFYRDCVISGTIDFIFGNGAVVLQNCTFVVRKPMENQQCIVTAQGRIDPRQPTGLVLQNCSFVADSEYYPVRSKLKSYLGRPWKEYSRTIIMESFIDDLIQKEGWLPWNGDFALDTLFYTEYNNRGPSSSKEERVKWKGVKELPLNRIERFTAARFIQGDVWIKRTRLPYNPGFIYPPPKHSPEVKYSPVMPDEIKDMGAKEKAAYDPPKASPPPPPPSPPMEPPPRQFSFSSFFGGGGGGGGGSPPTQEPADSSNQTSPPTSTPVHPSPESTSGSSSAPVQAPASSPGPVQAPHQFSTTVPISVTPVSAPIEGEAPTQVPTSTFGPGSPGPVQALPQSSTAPVSSPVQASTSTPSPVQASASTPSPVQAPTQSPTTAPVSASTLASASAPSPASPGPAPPGPAQASAPSPVSTPASTPPSPAPAPAQPSTPPSTTPVSAPAPAPTQASTSASSPAPLAPTQVPVATPLGNSATQVPAAAPPENSATQVPTAAPPGNSATHVPAAAPPGNSTTQVPTATPPGNSTTQVPAAAPPGNSATQVPTTAPAENSATQVPTAAPPGNSATHVPTAALPGNSTTQVPAAAPPGNSATQVPIAAPPGNSTTQVPAAAPPGNSATQVPTTAPAENSATQVPTAAPPGNSTTQVPAAAPPINSAIQVSTTAPAGNSATEVPVAAPAPSGNLDTQVKVAAASSENLIATPSTQTKAALGPSAEAGVKTPSPPRNQQPKSSGWTFGIF